MAKRLLTIQEVDYLRWLVDRMPCPICQTLMQPITAIRPGYTETRWACPQCRFNVNRGAK